LRRQSDGALLVYPPQLLCLALFVTFVAEIQPLCVGLAVAVVDLPPLCFLVVVVAAVLLLFSDCLPMLPVPSALS
jgi:hypothetical protein